MKDMMSTLIVALSLLASAFGTTITSNPTTSSVNDTIQITTSTVDTTQIATSTVPAHGTGTNNNETEALEFLLKFNELSAQNLNNVTIKSWNVDTNITDYNEEELVKQQSISATFDKQQRDLALQFNATAMSPDVQRQLNKIKDIGTSAQPNQTKVEELAQVMTDMESIYGKAKVFLNGKRLPLDPDITNLMSTSRNYSELLALWTGWRDETGRKMKSLYSRYVELSNEAVQFLGYKDYGEEWRSGYESDTFIDEVHDLFDQVTPLYEHLHAFVRRRLKKAYGESRFPASGHIPAHLLGNMWAQQWDTILDLLKPYENKTAVDVTPEMIKQNYTVEKIFRTAEAFFASLGFEPMVPKFWNLSMLERPNDGREVVCHASAWDFYKQDDFRIKMCTVVNQQDLMTVHHEMGHIEYYMQYRHQPTIYRNGANDGFHEAVGDVMALSAQTPEHMKKLGLINETTDDEADINFLMNMALQKVAFLPFGYLIDQWRWSVFAGTTTPDQYNRDWWKLRCHLQGISPPVARSEDDFDPGAKYHVAAGVPYLRYFISFIVQFQFHKAACEAAKHTGPLHRCDIFGSPEAGRKLRNMLSLGSSQPWQVAMKQLTGQEKMSAEPLMEYFKPLLHFLRKENGDDYGWDPHCPDFSRSYQGTTPQPGGGAGKIHMSWLILLIVFLQKLLY